MSRETTQAADVAREQGEWERAAGLYETVLARDAGSVEAAAGLGISLVHLGRMGQALHYLTRPGIVEVADATTFVALGDAYFALGNIDLAVRAFERAVDRLPESGRVRVKLAHGLIRLYRVEEAEALLHRAIELEPDLASAYDVTAFLLPQMGRFAEAQEYARKAVELEPNNPTYGVRFVYGAKVVANDADVVDRLLALADSDSLTPYDRIRVEFSLGKALEDLERYGASAQHYIKANTLCDSARRQRGEGFDSYAHRRDVDTILSAFPERSGAASRGGYESDLPVFIVGMMRSGSTLVEQILSSHSDVGGAGELPYWLENAPALLPEVTKDPVSPRALRMAERYVEQLRTLAPGKKRVCDKLLQNYMALGILHAALPKARIIHCRRDPRDTCLSIFTTPFTYPPPFAYRPESIGFAYREYLRLMERWRSVLPADRFLEVDYEDLVTDRENVSRRMIEFIDLDWDEACAHPEANPRLVANPSQWQVRQPVYGSSIGRWRRFEPWMAAQIEHWSPPSLIDK